MTRYIALRLVAIVPILLGISLLLFVMVDLSPNDPASAALGIFASPADRAAFAERNGLSDPLPVRYARFVGDIVRGDLGESAVRPESVNELVGAAVGVTIQLALLATLLSVVASALLGTLAALFEGGRVDKVIGLVAGTAQATPEFWVGVIAVQIFAVQLGWFPSGGYRPPDEGLQDWARAMTLPAVVLALPFSAAMTRVLRASLAQELSKDYVRTARGAGLPMSTVLFTNVLRNALLSPLTILGLRLGGVLSGAILVETVFNLPGLGTLLITGVTQGDLAVVRGVALIGAVAFVLTNLAVDVAYRLLNPRSALAGAG